MSFFSKLFGDPNAKVIAGIQPIVERINALEPALKELTAEQLKAKTPEFKERLAKGETLDDILPEAFAVVREMSRRLTGMRHFDVQLMGGIVLHRGNIAEMHTGEGKTLTATLPVYLNALSGKGVHVVTVNDYLAKRDAVWMGQIYDALGLSVGIIQNQMVSYRYSAHARKTDETAPALEVKQVEETSNTAQKSFSELAEGSPADKERDAKGSYKVEYDFLESCTRQEAHRSDIVYGTNNEFGFDYLRDNMSQSTGEQVLHALNFAIVDEVDSILIDEARTPLIISAPMEEATERYYRFAELVERLEENTDYNIDEKMRAATLSENGIKKMEEWLGISNIYAEGGVATVHHVEQALRAKALFKRDRDYVIENGEVLIVDEFTGRKMPGRRYSEGLHQAIEAKEKVKIQRESQTMATVTFQNFFRMYAKLSGMTGTAVTEAEEFGKIYKLEVVVIPANKGKRRVDHPDRIYRTQHAKFKAIAMRVKELQAKGQPVLIGTVSVVKNELLAQYLEQEGVKFEVLNAKNHEREGEIVAQAGRPGAVTLATNMAGRGVDIILGGNPAIPADAEKVRSLGGLFVIGTERHESRRIDNQLRGRSGRQGDPGETQFYLSTEDDLMRIFAGDRIKAVMEALKVPDDMPIEQRSLTRIIESAQKKVEGFHFDTRKHLLEYDDVLNRHREVIYGNRRKVLASYDRERAVLTAGAPALTAEEKTLRAMIFDYVEREVEQVVAVHTSAEEGETWNMKEITETVATIFPLSTEEREAITAFSTRPEAKLHAAELRTKLIEHILTLARAKYDELIIRPFQHPELILEIEKQIMLRSIDNLWVEHLVAVDYLRTGIGLRGYGQRDPLVEYKKETYRMFNELLSLIQKEVVYTIFKVGIGMTLAPSVVAEAQKDYQAADASTAGVAPHDHNHDHNHAHDGHDHAHGHPHAHAAPASKNQNPPKEMNRNDLCYCGSGKKFKKCHGA